MQSTASINLLKKKVNFSQEFTKWALNVGRFLIILVEILAFGTFVWRFTIDRQLVDLHDEIEQKQNLIGSLEENENRFRNLQDRLLIAKTATQNGSNNVNTLSEIVELTPPGITFNSIELTNKVIVINSNVSSVGALSNFIKNLRDNPKVNTVNIDRIDNKEGSVSIGVSLTIQLK